MSLDPQYEERLQKTMAEIQSGQKPEKGILEVTDTFENISQKLNDLATILLTGDQLPIKENIKQDVEDDYVKYFPEETAVVNDSSLDSVLKELHNERSMCWQMAEIYLRKKDARGLHDVGLEIQAIDKAINEIQKIKR